MSKIGRLPIEVKDSVTVVIDGQIVTVKGSKGEATHKMPKGINARLENGQLLVSQEREDDRELRAFYGLTRALLQNIVTGVDTGFEKKLEIQGVGYRAQMQGTDLVLSLGFAHPVKFSPKEGVTIGVKDNVITVSGTDKMLVGEMAAKIRGAKPPEPYKGKGIRYEGERVRRKAGKAAKAVGGK